MESVLLWTKIVKQSGKRHADFQGGRFFFYLVVSVIAGNPCGVTSIKTHMPRNRWALLILINQVTLTPFPFVAEQADC